MRITDEVKQVCKELALRVPCKPEQVLVLGCSTSEVAGKRIGTAANLAIAQAIWEGVLPFVREKGLYLACQCCEHLNRALVVERKAMEQYGWEEVTVFPVPEAGGSFAYQAMQNLPEAVVVEKIEGDIGVDIGDTFLGMHLKPVAVPLRLSLTKIGQAHLTLAYTRPKLIGGERASYQRPKGREENGLY